jgi:hypothetical protein
VSRLVVGAAAVIIASVTLAAGGWAAYVKGLDRGRSEVRAAWATSVEQQNAAATELSRQLQKAKDDALKKSSVRQSRNASDARSAGAELERLRLAAPLTTPADPERGGDSCPAATQRINTLTDIFRQCAGELVDLARKADGHAADAVMLQEAWPSK